MRLDARFNLPLKTDAAAQLASAIPSSYTRPPPSASIVCCPSDTTCTLHMCACIRVRSVAAPGTRGRLAVSMVFLGFAFVQSRYLDHAKWSAFVAGGQPDHIPT